MNGEQSTKIKIGLKVRMTGSFFKEYTITANYSGLSNTTVLELLEKIGIDYDIVSNVKYGRSVALTNDKLIYADSNLITFLTYNNIEPPEEEDDLEEEVFSVTPSIDTETTDIVRLSIVSNKAPA